MVKTYTADEIKLVLEQHRLWLRDDSGTRAYLTGADLSGAYLTGADLSNAILSRADLSGADLSGAYLTGADLSNAILRGANLTGANLTGAYLTGADLTGAYLTGAYLTGAILSGANLSHANLTGAYLSHFQIVPPCGSFLGYKKVIGDKVLTLEIPADARRTSSLVGRKCRCDKATVLSAVDLLSGKEASPASWYSSLFDPSFLYNIGGTVEEPTYDDDIRVECTRGIHFYITPEEAMSN